MKKYQIIFGLLIPFITSCSVNSSLNTKYEKDNSNDNNYQNNLDSESDINSLKNSSDTTSSIKTVNTQLVSEPSKNLDPNTLVSEPSKNLDPNTLVSEPSKNLDPNTLVSKPAENIDPGKLVSVQNGKGFSNITFNDGSNEVTLNLNLTDFQILSTTSSDNIAASFEINIKMNGSFNNVVKVEKDYFEYQTSFVIKLKGLKTLDNLDVSISSKDSNGSVIKSKQLINEPIKSNKSFNSDFSKNNSLTKTISANSEAVTTSTEPLKGSVEQSNVSTTDKNNEQGSDSSQKTGNK